MSERVRVLHVQRRPFPHEQFSIERVFADVRAGLPDDVDVDVLVSSFPSKGVLNRLRAIREARTAARARRPDVCHVTGDVHFLVLGFPRDRTVLTVHDCEPMHRLGPIARALYRLVWLTLPTRRAAVVTVPSPATRDELLGFTRVRPDRIHVVPNPVSPTFTNATRRDHDTFTVLQVGTRPNKNLARVAEALEGLPCALDVVGPLTAGQRALLHAHEISHRQHLDLDHHEMAQRYQNADVLVFASTREGFGLPILEAQASGLPVVTSDRSPMRDVAGDGALLVDPDDPAAIRAALERLRTGPSLRARLVAAGFANVARYRAPAIAEQHARIYRDVTRRAR